MRKIIAFGKTDIGLRRYNNEDAFVVEPATGYLLVADGMGGAASGEVASRLFTEAASRVFSKVEIQSEQHILELVQDVFRTANERILHASKENPEHQGMGCTAELIVFHDESYVVGHVGDSRTYLFRQGQLHQITKDHSFVQDQVDHGFISQAEARKHSFKNIILRAVGIHETLAVDMIKGKAREGDIFLLCSDGLTDMVDDAAILKTLMLPVGLPEKADQLISLANAAGGFDNITVALCEVE